MHGRRSRQTKQTQTEKLDNKLLIGLIVPKLFVMRSHPVGGDVFFSSGGFSVCMNGGGCFGGFDMGWLVRYLCVVALLWVIFTNYEEFL